MKHYTIVGNWKMHQTPDQAVRLVKKLQAQAKPHTHVTSVICPPFLSLPYVEKEVQKDLFKLGAQNMHEQDEGAFTGEISGLMLTGMADYVIVGHSERRQHEHETDKRIAKKVAAALRHDITPILCVGEKLSDRQENHARRVVVDQLHGGLSQITSEEVGKLIVAYEPVWAIGSGESATPDQVEPIVNVIRQTIEEMFGEQASGSLEILYGGSVNPDNIKSFLALKHINGALVGGASLNYEQFIAMIETAADLSNAR